MAAFTQPDSHNIAINADTLMTIRPASAPPYIAARASPQREVDASEAVGYSDPISMASEVQHIITAMGLCNALGSSVDAVFERACAGDRRLEKPPFELPFETLCGIVTEPLSALPATYRAYDTRLTRIALRALAPMVPALEKVRARVGSDRVGVVIGTSTGGLDATEPAYRHFRSHNTVSPEFSLRRAHAFDALSQLLADLFALQGPRFAVSTACTSSAKALASAMRLINAGACDAVLVGGADSLCETTLRGFQALGVLSQRGSRPFAQDRDGIHIGEGAAFLLLERDGDGPVRLLGVGESSDAHSMSAPQPEGLGAAEAMRRALLTAGRGASEVDYVNAHGTGTDQNDSAESSAIRLSIGEHVKVSSTKGVTGHLLGAAGATEAVIGALSIVHQVLPLSTGCEPTDPTLGIHVLTQTERTRVKTVLSNSLAFGGSNACVALGAP